MDKQIEQMDTCSLKLKEYCDLKSKGKSLTEFEKDRISRFIPYFGCNRELSKHHYHRTFTSFNIKLKSLMDAKERLISLLIRGELEEMKKEQEKGKICHLSNASLYVS